MKIEELSVGDWVMYRNREWQVCSLYQFTGEVGLWRNDSQICENVADLHPIPLTPEILKMNGWREDKTDPNFFSTDEVYIYNHEGVWRLRPKSTELLIVVDIKHVHELQRALRLLGVEKEIEL